MKLNLIIGYVAIVVSIAIVLSTYFAIKKKNKNITLFLKVVAGTLAAFFVVRYLWKYMAITGQYGISAEHWLKDFSVPVLLWFGFFNVLIAIFNTIFDIKFLRMLNTFFVLPVSFLSAVLYYLLSVGVAGDTVAGSWDAQVTIYAIELGVTLALSAVVFYENRKIKFGKADWKNFALLLIPMLLACMPGDFVREMFGLRQEFNFVDFSMGHRICLYIGIAIPLLIFIGLKDKPLIIRKFGLMYIAFATLVTFSHSYNFSRLMDPPSWPLHLCHVAMYLIPLCLVFKMNRLFYFTFFINVIGAILALFIPNYSAEMSWTSTGLYRFYYNHYMAYSMPILIVALKMYPRPTFKQFKYAIAGFAGYFVLVLIINAWFTNYESSVDFFFINGSFITDKLGQFGKWIRSYDVTIKLGDLKFIFYPIYQAVFFLVYIGFGALMWFIFELGFQVASDYSRLNAARIKLRQDEIAFETRLGGRNIVEPVNLDGVDMLKIENFSKKYGTNKKFAVQGVSLEVHDGEIFGFLGPNGAGKSTIIKSIVGLQPATAGSIEICGFDIEHQSVKAKMNIGFVPDHYALYENLTGREYINYIADIYKVTKEDRNIRIEEMLKKLNLQEAFDVQIKTYSHGMKQKIAIMAALTHKPKIWILDEPLTGLDPNSIYQVKEMMKQYAAEGNIVFFSSHIIDVVERICDRIAIIKNGQVVTDISVKQLSAENKKLEEYYLGIIGEELQSANA